jgi:hypothetical protein
MARAGFPWTWAAAAVTAIALLACEQSSPPPPNEDQPPPGQVFDEARRARRTAASFPAAGEDYFHDMDGGIALTPGEIKGRNTWIVWSGGDDLLWDVMSRASLGTLDFLKTLSSHPKLKASRDKRWNYLGLVNEPCFEKATGPDPKHFDLWLDKRKANCPPDPFADETKYPGVKIGARGTTVPVGSYYGEPSGIVGLRLFTNPAFDEEAKKKWDARRYYEDETYYANKDLVKPYRVGMTCAFCHVGPSPTHPPANPENPAWADLSSVVGTQYFWIDRIFDWEADPTSFPQQLFRSSRPGTLDTSLISTDNINNPRTMNAFYGLPSRLGPAKRWGREALSGGELGNKQLNDYVKEGALTGFYQRAAGAATATVWTPHVLKDGSDSVGALGALNRVYLNIGLYSEEWLRHFNALVGGKPTTKIEIATAERNSVYWQATETMTPDTAMFFLKSTSGHRLEDAPGGKAFLTADKATLDRGKHVFADRCARCHSSKIPSPAPGLDPDGCAGPGYLDCWNKYWAWTRTPDFKAQMTKIVMADDFLADNYLSTEMRVPVTLLETNACSPLATNALRDDIWDNFSSQSYKELPSVGKIKVRNPVTGEESDYEMPAGGRGYTRVPSLISLWSTAPFLQNNAVGLFDPSPSVEARMKSFQDSIEKLLWPEKREKDSVLGDKIPGPSLIDRTTSMSELRVAAGYVPNVLQPLLDPAGRVFPKLVTERGIRIGPIPEGTPVNLLANLDLLPPPGASVPDRLKHDKDVLDLLLKVKLDLINVPQNATNEQAKDAFRNLVDPLLRFSKCPDFIVNKGHYFGTGLFKEEPGLVDPDKRALIEFLKTL